MPLSEHEQRMLDEMERNLYGGDSDVHPARERAAAPNYSAVVWGVLIGLVGLGLLIVGVMTQLMLLGVAGFAVLFAGAIVATRRSSPHEDRESSGNTATASASSGKSARRGGMTFMQRMEKRWDERS